jgi:hypothetical protein
MPNAEVKTNSKHQAPNLKQIPKSKHKNSVLCFGHWNFEVVWKLEFGIFLLMS